MRVKEAVKKNGKWVEGRHFEISGTRNLRERDLWDIINDIKSEGITRYDFIYGWFFIEEDDDIARWSHTLDKVEELCIKYSYFIE